MDAVSKFIRYLWIVFTHFLTDTHLCLITHGEAFPPSLCCNYVWTKTLRRRRSKRFWHLAIETAASLSFPSARMPNALGSSPCPGVPTSLWTVRGVTSVTISIPHHLAIEFRLLVGVWCAKTAWLFWFEIRFRIKKDLISVLCVCATRSFSLETLPLSRLNLFRSRLLSSDYLQYMRAKNKTVAPFISRVEPGGKFSTVTRG